MTPREFFKHVVLMRHAATQWYNTHDKQALQTAKRLERECDAEIAAACVADAEMESFVREHYPELANAIQAAKHQQYDLFNNQ